MAGGDNSLRARDELLVNDVLAPQFGVCVRVRVRARACACVRMRACVRACVRVCVYVCFTRRRVLVTLNI